MAIRDITSISCWNSGRVHTFNFEIAVEGDLGEFAFSTLKKSFPGKVLLNPTSDIYHNYITDDASIIYKLRAGYG